MVLACEAKLAEPLPHPVAMKIAVVETAASPTALIVRKCLAMSDSSAQFVKALRVVTGRGSSREQAAEAVAIYLRVSA